MSQSTTLGKLAPARTAAWLQFTLVLALGWALAPLPAAAELDAWLEPLVQGTVSMNVRARYEFADINAGPDPSHALTLRTRLGYRTKPWEGLSAFVEALNIVSVDSHAYFDGIPPTNGKSVVADPDVTEINQAYLLIDREDFGNSLARIGRQRIVLDDARFIGNVGWRQNEQTYDALFGETALGIEGLALQYGWVFDVNRIFGNQGTTATRDFESNSHLIRASYEFAPWLQLTGFAYLLDLRDSPLNSSDTYGVRAAGKLPLADDWSVAYQGSWAYQVDGGTSGGNNPRDYIAHYGLADLSLAFAPAGSIGGGYEFLGSDDGRSQFRTPLATAHKFNGWADAFLNNGGPGGLQDIYVYVSPRLPYGFKGKFVFHQFYSDDKGRNFGQEYDAVLSRKLGKYVTALTKVAYYEGVSSKSPATRVRYWFELTFDF